MNIKRKLTIVKLYWLSLVGKNHKKAETLRKSKLFEQFGGGGYWHPNWIPSYPELVSVGNNVTVAADVGFYEHDEINRLWNGDSEYKGEYVPYKKGKIIIEDNVVLGARSIILYDVTIGHHSLVASGSVVTKDVLPYTIVGGNPAKIIGSTNELLKKRTKLENKQ
jgi:acetyltransferase-like isoleucine patch superfamily enzyme